MTLFQKIANFSLAVVLLVATTGVTLNKHYCMGRLISVAIFEPAPPCSGNDTSGPMPCCSNESEELKVEEITTVSFDFEIDPDFHQLTLITHFILNEFIEDETNSFFIDYSPPKIVADIQAMNQVYLI